MPFTLAQYAQLERDELKKGIMLELLRHSPLMNFVPFEDVDALNVKAMRWERLPSGGTWRPVNGSYPEIDLGQVGEVWESVYGFGGEFKFDKIFDHMKNYIEDPKVAHLRAFLKSRAMDWNNAFINGDIGTNPDAFDGIKKRVAAMDSRQTIWFAANGGAPYDPTADGKAARTFFRKLNAAIKRCNGGKASLILANEAVIEGMEAVAYLLQAQGNYFDVTKDMLGRTFTTYKDIPIVDPGLLQDQTTEIITNTEVAGDGGADSTSIYVVSIDRDEGLHGIQATSPEAYDPLKGAEMESKPATMLRIDWWNGIATFGRRCIVRLRNLEAPSDWTEAVS
ncbi:MAG: hypothetical protein GXY44_06515 [Phycisphaerales bacterium]|nr:hypothetical protein [Phycisphaerales bacterium]